MEQKYCKYCNELKPIDEFYKSQKSLICKFHHKLIGKENKKKYRQNPENKLKEKLKTQERNLRLWVNNLLHSTKRRHNENTLTVDDVIEMYKNQNGLCYWFKIPLIPSLIKKHPQQPSLDRLDRLKGYTKENVVLTCYSANIGRNETNLETWKIFIQLLNPNPNLEFSIDNEYQKIKNVTEELNDKDEFVIYDENLNQTVVKNLNDYAKKNKISQNTIKSSRKKTKGSTQKGLIILNRSKNESVEKRIYTLISPDGTKFNLTSLREFCINNNLNDSALHRVGKGKLKHYKGWKCEYDKIILK